MTQVNIHEAKTNLSKLIERALQGEEFIIARAGKPVARLTAIQPTEHGRCFGAMKGKARVDDKFFEPLPEEEIAAWE
ncbi:MAG: type II toxin-antitoxin system Phd/YefM family antitoxin [Candidatus Competibacteraceae bacterium]|jgi:prevent-host-death family protein|nr:type II toxin-antitoxin system Phd/YefM family antitoxin [Candidatus Competibacteraceae bacterium]